jgi:outer membrane protein OmpA-like peptidoglycan-associated protein
MPRLMYVAFGVGMAVAVGICAWFFAIVRFHPMNLVEIAKRDSPATFAPVSTPSSVRKREALPQPPETLPKFDVVRLDPEGASVFAGSAGAHQRVTILINGREFASALADSDGQWAIVVERPIPTGQVELALIASGPEQGRTSRGQVIHMTVAAPRVASHTPEVLAHKTAQSLAPRPEADAKQDLRRFEEFVERARATAHEASAAPSVQAPLPVPITFLTDEAVMTPDGNKAARLLADYLRITKSQAIALTGHADSRGPKGYNLELSRRRLAAIEQFLRTAGYEGGLKLVPLGETVPYRLVDRSKLSREQTYQLDRRVELQVTGLTP